MDASSLLTWQTLPTSSSSAQTFAIGERVRGTIAFHPSLTLLLALPLTRGSRFSYTFYRPSPDAAPSQLGSRARPDDATPIHRSIRQLDDEGMQAIALSPPGSGGGKKAKDAQSAFAAYIRSTKNTVCGRHPIGVLLGALASLEAHGNFTDDKALEVRFTRYEVSTRRLRGSRVAHQR